jgi:hypothetical protein
MLSKLFINIWLCFAVRVKGNTSEAVRGPCGSYNSRHRGFYPSGNVSYSVKLHSAFLLAEYVDGICLYMWINA